MSVQACRMDDESLLLQEFNHRLFNTFQIIGSEVSQCSRASRADLLQQSLWDLGGRIRALARLHRLLATPLDDLLEDRCREICLLLIRSFGRDDIALWVRMEDLPLDRGQQLRVALLVVELVTNVIKHSLIDERGTVWVDLRANQRGAELSVSDSRRAQARCKTPSRIVRSLAQSLAGEARVVDHDGYTACVRFPLVPPGHVAVWRRAGAQSWARACD
jgi:two-component sensor histidine kinase